MINMKSLLLLSFIFTLSCAFRPENKSGGSHEFNEKAHELKVLYEDNLRMRYAFVWDADSFLLNIHVESEEAVITIDDTSFQTALNFTYDTDLYEALESIKILSDEHQETLIFVLPTFTEEFLTCQLIRFERKTKHLDYGIFEIDTHKYDQVRHFYTGHPLSLIQNEQNYSVRIEDFEYTSDFSTEYHEY